LIIPPTSPQAGGYRQRPTQWTPSNNERQHHRAGSGPPKGADRQILADAVAADAAYLITNDVDDFAEVDLVSEKVAAVTPDFFMALRFTGPAYQRALAQLVASLNNPPKTIEQMHALIGRRHRRLHQRFAALYPDSEPLTTPAHEPRVLYRGARCVVCGRSGRDPQRLELGCHSKCLAAIR
jgi:hypothetical protein